MRGCGNLVWLKVLRFASLSQAECSPSSIREPDGITLVLSESVRDQISDGVAGRRSHGSPGGCQYLPPPGGGPLCRFQPGPPAGASAVKEQPAEASVSDEAPLSESVAKREDEVPARPLLSDNCLIALLAM